MAGRPPKQTDTTTPRGRGRPRGRRTANVHDAALGSAIARARAAAGGVSQEKLARTLDVSTMTVSRWERGVIGVSYPVLCRIAAALDTTPESIVAEAQRL